MYKRQRVDDRDGLVGDGGAAADDGAGALAGGRVDGAVPRQVVRDEAAGRGRGVPVAAGDDEGRLGQSVGGVERLAPEAGPFEGRGEPVERAEAYGLGAVEGEPPGAQVEGGAVLLGDLRRAEVVREVGRAAERGPVLGDGPQPADGALEEGERRHVGHRVSAVRGGQQAEDEAQVVVGRQPGDHVVVGAGAVEPPVLLLEVVQQVGVRDHHALGAAGGSRGVLQEGQVVAGEVGVPPGVRGRRVDGVDAQPGRLAEGGGEGGEVVGHGGHRGGGEDDGGPGVLDDADQARQRALEEGGVRRVHRHRGHPRVEAGEERGHVVRAGGAEDQGAFPGGYALLEGGRDRADPQVRLGVGAADRGALAVDEEPEDALRRVFGEDGPEMLDQCRGFAPRPGAFRCFRVRAHCCRPPRCFGRICRSARDLGGLYAAPAAGSSDVQEARIRKPGFTCRGPVRRARPGRRRRRRGARS